MHEIEVAGLRIVYERAGEGPPLVLVHGFVGDGRSTWQHQIDGLSDEFTVVAWTGRAPVDQGIHPSRSGCRTTPTASPASCTRSGWDALTSSDSPSVERLRNASDDVLEIRAAGEGRPFRRERVAVPSPGFRAMALASAESDLRDVLPRIDVPTLLLYGDEDARAPLTVAESLRAAIPASKLVVMPGVGHVSSVEAAARFTTEVRDFLHENPP